MSEHSRTGRLTKIMSLFAVLIGIAVFFGYSLGKDMALRDNARDTALEAAS